MRQPTIVVVLRGPTGTNYAVPDIGRHLAMNNQQADQVMDAAMGHICPDVHIGASGAPINALLVLEEADMGAAITAAPSGQPSLSTFAGTNHV
jgi:hypothetical protein